MRVFDNDSASPDGGRRPARQPLLRRKLGVISSYFLRRPLWCTWQVTYRCNFRCDMCNYWRAARTKEEQPLAAFEAGAAKLSSLGNLLISLAGGEPLLRDDIIDIVAILAERHLPMITTNGWLASRETARELWDAGMYGASVSIDFADPGRHDEARGVAGAFERAVAALDYFSSTRTQPRQKLNLMTVLRSDNLDDIEKLIILAQKHRAYLMLQPYSAVKTGDKSHIPPADCVGHLLKLKKRYPHFLSNTEFIQRFTQATNGGVPGCVAGRSFFNIDTNGDVSRCVEFRNEPVANLGRDSMKTITKRLTEEYRANTCRSCWYNCRGEIEVMYSPRGFFGVLRKVFNG